MLQRAIALGLFTCVLALGCSADLEDEATASTESELGLGLGRGAPCNRLLRWCNKKAGFACGEVFDGQEFSTDHVCMGKPKAKGTCLGDLECASGMCLAWRSFDVEDTMKILARDLPPGEKPLSNEGLCMVLKKTAGALCLDDSHCNAGLICGENYADSTMRCVKKNTKSFGEVCDRAQNEHSCAQTACPAGSAGKRVTCNAYDPQRRQGVPVPPLTCNCNSPFSGHY